MITRRKFIHTSAQGVAAGAALLGAPYVYPKNRPVLRVLGTHVTLREPIRQRAERDLGFSIQFEPGGDAHVLQKASSRPDTFDIYELWNDSIRILWRVAAIQPLEVKRIQRWSEVNDLTKTGRLTPEAKVGLGDAPHRLLFVQPNGRLGNQATGQISFMPYVHNVDAFGYDTRFVKQGIPYETESWAWLMEETYHGKVALINAPTIGIFDMALAAEAMGLMKFADMGNMTKAEVDQLFAFFLRHKQLGHFSGFWNSVPESADFIASGRAYLGSMFSPAVADLNERGIPAVYAAPKEGYRAWHGVMCLSSQTQGRVKDMAYEFMNWWLDGWAGAFVARQGYYISVPERVRPHLTAAEWDYWYLGKPAATDLLGPEGQVAVKAGHVRNGGSYWKRFSHVAVWNTVMDTYDYTLPRWYEFLLA